MIKKFLVEKASGVEESEVEKPRVEKSRVEMPRVEKSRVVMSSNLEHIRLG